MRFHNPPTLSACGSLIIIPFAFFRIELFLPFYRTLGATSELGFSEGIWKKNRPPGGRGGEGGVFRAVFAPPLWPRKNGKALTGIALPPSDVLMYASEPQGPSETPPGLLQVA